MGYNYFMKKEIIKITKDILIGDLVEVYPELAKILVENYGFHCIGCMAAGMETLEEGAIVHGMDKKEILKMVADLKKLAEKDGE
jgi:hybrid cluster-associated redox disulfide protein